MSSSRRQRENLKNRVHLSGSSNFSSISIFLHINFYYNGGIACREERHDIKRWKKDMRTCWGAGKSRQIWVEMVLHHNGAQTITLSFRLCLCAVRILLWSHITNIFHPSASTYTRPPKTSSYCLSSQRDEALFYSARKIEMLFFCWRSFMLRVQLGGFIFVV